MALPVLLMQSGSYQTLFGCCAGRIYPVEAESDWVQIGATLLEMVSSKVILMMLLTLVLYVLLDTPNPQGAQQQYAMNALYLYRTGDIAPALTEFR